MLTLKKIQAAKPKEKPYKLFDGGGLYLEVMPGGSRYWRMKYRRPDRKEDRMAFGVFPGVTLADARAMREQAKLALRAGVDPKLYKKQKNMELTGEFLFKKIALKWHGKNRTWSEDHKKRVLRTIERYIFPYLGNLDIRKIITKDLLKPVLATESKELKDVPKRVMGFITRIMRYAVQHDIIKTNPALDMQGILQTVKSTYRPALPLKHLPDFLAKIENYHGKIITKCAIEITLLTFLRSSEVRFARWSEIDFKTGIWNIPGQREALKGVKFSHRGMKMQTPHTVMLSRQAKKVIDLLYQVTGTCNNMFPGIFDQHKVISDCTVNKALRAMGYNTKTEVCGHGFRTMARQALTECGLFNDDAIENQLSHQPGRKEKAAYMHTTKFIEERTLMMQFWADYLDANRKEHITPFEFSKRYKHQIINN